MNEEIQRKIELLSKTNNPERTDDWSDLIDVLFPPENSDDSK